MNSRERLLTALSHREPDRIPFDLGSTQVTGIHAVAYRNLRQALGRGILDLGGRDDMCFIHPHAVAISLAAAHLAVGGC